MVLWCNIRKIMRDLQGFLPCEIKYHGAEDSPAEVFIGCLKHCSRVLLYFLPFGYALEVIRYGEICSQSLRSGGCRVRIIGCRNGSCLRIQTLINRAMIQYAFFDFLNFIICNGLSRMQKPDCSKQCKYKKAPKRSGAFFISLYGRLFQQFAELFCEILTAQVLGDDLACCAVDQEVGGD